MKIKITYKIFIIYITNNTNSFNDYTFIFNNLILLYLILKVIFLLIKSI